MLPTIRSSKELDVALAQDLPKYFVRAEIDRILATVSDRPRDLLLMTMLWQTGARLSEMLDVKVRDVDLNICSISIRTLKRKRKPRRVLPIKPEMTGPIAEHIVKNRLEREDILFDIKQRRAQQIIEKAVLKAGFERERAHPHTFRHSFAVNCLLQTQPVPLTVLKEWLGHSNISSTLIYTKILARDSRQYFDNIEF